MFPFMPHPIHFCSQWLHLWVTASPEELVYRLHIRKYFGTEIWPGAEADSRNSFLGKGPGVLEHLFPARVCLSVRVFAAP
jgi:hypothetical protein